uniref:Uncharacterized protein n=1 Tax=Pyrodinium bahamense TaxID=73915 RepID=A0A7S0B6J8_9DINO
MGSPVHASFGGTGGGSPVPVRGSFFTSGSSPEYSVSDTFGSVIAGPNMQVEGEAPTGCAGVFCEADPVITGTSWKFVGEGRGGYAQVHAYNYVGVGGGDWERQLTAVHTGWRLKKCCIGILSILIVVPFIYFLTPVLYSEQEEQPHLSSHKVVIQTAPPPTRLATVATTREPFNCHDSWDWTESKKAWCCERYGRGCTTTPTPSQPTTTIATYDCHAGLSKWVTGWSAAKKVWCCARKHLGCHPPLTRPKPPPVPRTPPPTRPPPPPAPTAPFDCNEDYVSCYHCLMHRWSIAKREWCCRHGGRGCSTPLPPATTPRPPPPQTTAPLVQHLRPTPPPPPTAAPFDCSVDYVECYHCLMHRWSVAKRQWCCQHGGRGCATSPPASAAARLPPRSTSPTSPAPGPPTEPPQQAPPEQHAKPPPLAPFDCNVDYVDCYHCLMKRWSITKREYCCKHGGRGCSTPLPPALSANPPTPATPLPGLAAKAPRPATPAPAGVAPPAPQGQPLPAASSLPFDCAAGLAHWQHGWSMAKKDWCCQHVHRGCPQDPRSEPFDCEAGYDNWKHGWSRPKKAWCCQHKHQGCPLQSTSLPYDCKVDYTSCYHCLQKRWSRSKREWCCQHGGRGCQTTSTSIPFDCGAGLLNWQTGWSPGKKTWCCQHAGKGCS